jgi:hypothetical protein
LSSQGFTSSVTSEEGKKVLSNEDTTLKEIYSSFKERLSFDDFQSNLNSLTIEDKWNFVQSNSAVSTVS